MWSRFCSGSEFAVPALPALLSMAPAAMFMDAERCEWSVNN